MAIAGVIKVTGLMIKLDPRGSKPGHQKKSQSVKSLSHWVKPYRITIIMSQ